MKPNITRQPSAHPDDLGRSPSDPGHRQQLLHRGVIDVLETCERLRQTALPTRKAGPGCAVAGCFW